MRVCFVAVVGLALVHVCQSNITDSDVIVNTSIPVRNAPYEQHHADVIGSITGVFGALLHTLIFGLIFVKSDNDKMRLLTFLFWFVGLVGFILFETEFFVNLWNTYVQRTKWDRETFIVRNTTVIYNTCASTVCNHGCENVRTAASSCSYMRSALIAGTCNNGYKCCKEWTYSYSCGSAKHPSTCWNTICLSSVGSLWCDVVVGKCADVQADVYFDEGSIRYSTIYHQHCGLNDSSCVSNLVKKYAPGFSFRASINPEAPNILVENISYKTKHFVGMVFGIIFLSAAYLFLLVMFCWWVWLNRDRFRLPHLPSIYIPDCSCLCDLFNKRSAPAAAATTPVDPPPAYKFADDSYA